MVISITRKLVKKEQFRHKLSMIQKDLNVFYAIKLLDLCYFSISFFFLIPHDNVLFEKLPIVVIICMAKIHQKKTEESGSSVEGVTRHSKAEITQKHFKKPSPSRVGH